MSPAPSLLNSGGRLTRFCDCVSQMAVEENSISAISVTMKAGMRMREMSVPLMKPISVPVASMTVTATATAEPLPARMPPPSSIRYPHKRAASEQCLIDGRRHNDRTEHADEPHDGALGQVDAADDDDEGLADCDR